MYLFYELLSFATYPLVTHHQDEEAVKSGRKYLGYIVGTSIGLALPALLATYMLSGGELAFGGGSMLAGNAGAGTAAVLLVLFLFGFAKGALMPMHGWLPAAMVAPTPVSALLHAVAVVKVGAFCIVRVVTEVFGVDMLATLGLGGIITAIAAVTMLAASLIALTQDGLKRRLAFSTIGQLSYIAMGVGLLTPLAVTGGVLHIAMHAFGKITLFFCAGAIYVATGEKYISRMGGLGRRMPWTMLAFFIGSLSIIGVPPTGGFLSKWHLLLGTVQAEAWVIMGVLLLSSLLNAAYFLPLVYRAWFPVPGTANFDGPAKEAPTWCLAPPLVTAAISVAVFFHPEPLIQLARMVAGL
jgi:multicomponent Na+:H+ antiporter subunit D